MEKFRPLGICLFLVAIIWLVFGQTLGFDFINHDDPDYVFANPHVSTGLTAENVKWAFTQTHSSNWHPLTWLSHMLDCQLFGLNAGAHHAINVLLHTLAVLLLFLVLWRMTDALWRSGFVAALFAIHPLRVESVVWVAERKDVLSAVLFMLTLGAYLGYTRRPSRARYLLVALLFACGLMAKPMLVTLPFVLILLDYWPLRRSLAWKKQLLEKGPLLLLVLASVVATLIAQRGAINSLQRMSIAARIANAFLSYVVYLRQMLWPDELAIVYRYVTNQFDTALLLGAIVLLAGLTVACVVRRRQNPYALTGWLWYVGMLVPVIGIVQVGSQVHADRYTYLPQIGLYIALTWAVVDLTASLKRRREFLSAGAAIVIAALSWKAYLQTKYWRDSETIWNHALAFVSAHGKPGSAGLRTLSADIHFNLGNAFFQNRELDRAIEQYQLVLRLRSNYEAETCATLGQIFVAQGKVDQAIPLLRKALQLGAREEAEIHSSLGNLLLAKGQTEEAIAHLQKALQRPSGESARVHYNIATALMSLGRMDEALVHYQRAIEIQPDYAQAHNNFGNALLRQGRVDEAIAQYRAAIAARGESEGGAQTHLNLGNALLQKGEVESAIAEYEAAIALIPNHPEAHNNLGNIFLNRQRVAEAIRHFEAALQSRPNYAEAHYNLGNAYSQQDKFNDAIAQYESALQIQPAYPDAQNNLANALVKTGRVREAIAHYDQALALDPKAINARSNLAWHLATSADSSIRDPDRAVKLAEEANRLTGADNAVILRTLAAAYAAQNRFANAIVTAGNAIEVARARGESDLARVLEQELARYEASAAARGE